MKRKDFVKFWIAIFAMVENYQTSNMKCMQLWIRNVKKIGIIKRFKNEKEKENTNLS